MTIYLSGPMTGLHYFNYPAFHAAATVLRSQGHVVVSPAELDGPDHVPGSWLWERYIARDILALMTCDEVRTLPGWESSRGARLEVEIAKLIGLPVRDMDMMVEPACPSAGSRIGDPQLSGGPGQPYGT